MRIKSYKFLSYILCFLLLLSGCSLPENAQGDSSDEKQQTINEGSDDLFPSVYTASDIGIQNLFLESGEVINRMEIDSDGNLYVFASNDSGEEIFISMKNGQEKREILDDYLGFIYYDEAREVFYTYNSIKNCIEVRNQDFEIDKLLLLDFCPFEIKEMLVRGNKLYILSIDENPYELDDTEYIFEEDDYTDFGEKLWAISL